VYPVKNDPLFEYNNNIAKSKNGNEIKNKSLSDGLNKTLLFVIFFLTNRKGKNEPAKKENRNNEVIIERLTNILCVAYECSISIPGNIANKLFPTIINGTTR
jgi:hypothetical protein